MAKNKEVYTVVKHWTEGSLNGIDIMGVAGSYQKAMTFIDDRAETGEVYCQWELEDLDDGDLDKMEIEDLDRLGEVGDESELMIYDMFGPAEMVYSCRYKFPSSIGRWTYAWFYIVASERIK